MWLERKREREGEREAICSYITQVKVFSSRSVIRVIGSSTRMWGVEAEMNHDGNLLSLEGRNSRNPGELDDVI